MSIELLKNKIEKANCTCQPKIIAKQNLEGCSHNDKSMACTMTCASHLVW